MRLASLGGTHSLPHPPTAVCSEVTLLHDSENQSLLGPKCQVQKALLCSWCFCRPGGKCAPWLFKKTKWGKSLCLGQGWVAASVQADCLWRIFSKNVEEIHTSGLRKPCLAWRLLKVLLDCSFSSYLQPLIQ